MSPLPPGWDESPAFNFGSFADDRARMREHLWSVHRIDAATSETREELDEIHHEVHERELNAETRDMSARFDGEGET
jgi:hypothetical protein